MGEEMTSVSTRKRSDVCFVYNCTTDIYMGKRWAGEPGPQAEASLLRTEASLPRAEAGRPSHWH